MNKRNGSVSVILGILIAVLVIGFAAYYIRSGRPTAEISEAPVQSTGTQSLPQPSTAAPSPVTDQVSYQNDQYGLRVALPLSWKGYSVLNKTWTGYKSGASGDAVAATGPMILLRNPAWSVAAPTQDLPVEIYTLSQWNDYQAGKFHFAAPVKDSELARNTRYVFALPARYNYGEEAAKEEVEAIIASHSVSAY